ncbi:MAG: HAMP domain-containing histidine kinase [Oscillospiraceae bacterium]|nr:HAMP domain-containing histidine kinase [Oscillospiraceae bacterium]
MFKSIFGRMFWTYAILLVFVISIITTSMTLLFSRFTERKQIETTSSVARSIEYWTATLQIEQTDALSARAYSRFLDSWSKLIDSDITVVNRDGEVFDSTCAIPYVPDAVLDCIEKNRITVHKSDFGGFYKSKVLTVAFPLHYKDNVIGAILFNKSIADLRHTVLELLLMFIFSALVSLLFAFIIVYIQARKISAPIVKINKTARMIASGSFGERVDITSRDEIGQLASTFNFMASSIEKVENNRQRFISDVSHELRTPMTSISGFVQGMLDGTIAGEKREEYLRIVFDESTRLTKLVNDMLDMSKMQSDSFKLDITAFDITELICVCLISLENRINDKNLDVEVDFRPENLKTLGDKDQIKRVIINLLDNAIKFSHNGSTIDIKTSITGGKAHITVSNKGDNIDENDIRHLFDRFYKTDQSRAKDRTGAGLGLSLVQNIIRLHNQTITVDCKPDEDGNTSTITFEFTLEVE